MGIRPAKCYRWDSPAYTRVSRNTADSFITGIPGSKITHFTIGNLQAKFDTEVSIVSDTDIQVRNNSLEAARVAINKVLEADVGLANYLLKIRVYPHHVLRENVMATGAGADRVQSGMRRSFGKPMGSAARVQCGQRVLTVYVNKADGKMDVVKKALKVGMSKLPTGMSIEVAAGK